MPPIAEITNLVSGTYTYTINGVNGTVVVLGATITLSNEPSQTGIGAIFAGETHAEIIARMSDPAGGSVADASEAVTDGTGPVARVVSVSAGSDPVVEGETVTIEVRYQANDAADLVRSVSAGTVLASPLSPTSAILMGQSEIEYLFNSAAYYRQVPQPAPGDGNLILFTQATNGTPPVRTVVNQTSVDVGQVTPAMAALSAVLEYAAPGHTFVVGDGAVSGTARYQLVSDDMPQRTMADYVAVVDAVEAETGDDVQRVIEAWYAADAQNLAVFEQVFWQYYFGVDQNGDTVPIGTEIVSGVTLDHLIWDATANPTEKGRGTFARDKTKWSILTPMPARTAATETEQDNFNSSFRRFAHPVREVLHDLANLSEAESVDLTVGPSLHISKFGPNDGSHPDVTDPLGAVQFGLTFAVPLLREAGIDIGEPVLSGVEVATDGSQMDVVIDLPNDGELSTPFVQRLRTARASLHDMERLAFDKTTRGMVSPMAGRPHPETHGDDLPAGWGYNGFSERRLLTLGSDPDPLIGWDLSNVFVQVRHPGAPDFMDNFISRKNPSGRAFMLQVDAGAGLGKLTRNTFEGPGWDAVAPMAAAIVGSPFLSDGDVTWAKCQEISFNTFYGIGSDYIKTGFEDVRIFGNYQDPFAAYKTVPTQYAAGTTYAMGDPVYLGDPAPTAGKTFYVSKVDGNQGNSPTLGASDDNWLYVDSHGDAINQFCGKAKIYCNVINMINSARQYPGLGETLGGVTSGIRGNRDVGPAAALPMDGLDAQRNLILYEPNTGGVPVTAGASDTPHKVKFNWCGAGPFYSGAIINPATLSGNDISDNIAYTYTGSPEEEIAPHHQEVTGFEIKRGGVTRPLFRLTETDYPADFRGTVRIFDTGSGTPKKGRIRIIPENPFQDGDKVQLLSGSATAELLASRDVDPTLITTFPIEYVPTLFDETAMYPLDGVAVRPKQTDVNIAVSEPVIPTPAFSPRGVNFDGSDHFYRGDLTVTGGSDGMFSLWMRNMNDPWSTPQSHILELREGSNMRMTLRAFGSGVMTLVIQTSTGQQTVNIFAGDGSSVMVRDRWYHLAAEWVGGGDLKIYVDGTLDSTTAIGTPLWDGGTLTQLGFGTNLSGGAKWNGDLAHAWFDPTQRLDLSQAANLSKFLNGDNPADLGEDGATPTGTAPAFYFDGEPGTWNNQGSAGALSLTGSLSLIENAPVTPTLA